MPRRKSVEATKVRKRKQCVTRVFLYYGTTDLRRQSMSDKKQKSFYMLHTPPTPLSELLNKAIELAGVSEAQVTGVTFQKESISVVMLP